MPPESPDKRELSLEEQEGLLGLYFLSLTKGKPDTTLRAQITDPQLLEELEEVESGMNLKNIQAGKGPLVETEINDPELQEDYEEGTEGIRLLHAMQGKDTPTEVRRDVEATAGQTRAQTKEVVIPSIKSSGDIHITSGGIEYVDEEGKQVKRSPASLAKDQAASGQKERTDHPRQVPDPSTQTKQPKPKKPAIEKGPEAQSSSNRGPSLHFEDGRGSSIRIGNIDPGSRVTVKPSGTLFIRKKDDTPEAEIATTSPADPSAKAVVREPSRPTVDPNQQKNKISPEPSRPIDTDAKAKPETEAPGARTVVTSQNTKKPKDKKEGGQTSEKGPLPPWKRDRDKKEGGQTSEKGPWQPPWKRAKPSLSQQDELQALENLPKDYFALHPVDLITLRNRGDKKAQLLLKYRLRYPELNKEELIRKLS